MFYSGENYEFLFSNSCENLTENVFESLRHKNVFRYRTKTIKSGNVLECEIFPLWNTKNEVRKANANSTRQAQKKLNEKNAEKGLIRKMNANFTPRDFHVTLTYRNNLLPDEMQARKDIRNFIRRIREYRRKNGLPELKYIYVVEFSDGDGRRTRVHQHVIMSGMNREVIKRLWGKGSVQVDELDPENHGNTLEGLARYIIKQPTKSRRWQASRNLIDPEEFATKSDTKLSRRKAEKLAADVNEFAPQIFGNLFPEYTFDDCIIKSSDFVAGVYIYARMHRTPPTKTKPKRKRRVNSD